MREVAMKSGVSWFKVRRFLGRAALTAQVVGVALLGACSSAAPASPDAAPLPDAPPADSAPAGDAVPAADTAPDAGTAGTGDATADAAGPGQPQSIPAEPQRTGDAQAGLDALLNKSVVTCGIPYSLYSMFFAAGNGGVAVPGRTGRNADLPYIFTSHTAPSGVEVIVPNCLSCHATPLGGQLVIGLGNASVDFTTDTASLARAADALVTDPDEKVEADKWAERVEVTGPFIRPDTVGVNPADNLAAIIFAHRDQQTLAWSHNALLEPPPKVVVPVDVPPWWRMKKKNSMFYTAAGRGDQARIMVTASTLCTDTVEEAMSIDAFAPDIRAFIASLEPPAYPYTVDATKAAAGKTVFDSACSSCHGTYGDNPTYPNLVFPIELVGTDPVLAAGASQLAQRFVDWFNGSFYGEMSRLDPQKGYVAPPLDGIWATAPFLHNGSVPTLEGVLDSSKRPTYFIRDFDPDHFDEVAVGAKFEELDHGKAGETDATRKKSLYDTTEVGYSNAGHTYGDHLSATDRTNLLEYLKTL
jgi:hypothetical protein